MEKILILESRKKYHKMLTDKKVLTISAEGIASNADSGNFPSIEISKILAKKLNAKVGEKLKGQTAGNLFEQITMQFLEEITTFASRRLEYFKFRQPKQNKSFRLRAV